jgi:hypothetical protein
VHLLPRDQMGPEEARRASDRWLPGAEYRGDRRELVDPSSFRARLRRGLLGAMHGYGLAIFGSADAVRLLAHSKWPAYVALAGIALLAAAHVGALVAVLRARRYASTVSR